jgi:hypothetical protein
MYYANRQTLGDSNKDLRLTFSDGSTVDVQVAIDSTTVSLPLVTTSSVRIDVISTYHRMNNGAEEISFCGEAEAVSQPPATSLGVNVSYEDPEPLADCRFYKANGDCPLNTIDYDTVDSLAECATWCRELPECSHFVFWDPASVAGPGPGAGHPPVTQGTALGRALAVWTFSTPLLMRRRTS